MTKHVTAFFCLALAWASAHLFADVVYSTKALAPLHRLEIKRSIAECRAKVRSAPDAETRARQLEELCKKLIQAEEYDEAIAVAKEVMNCEGADPERRAVHHFLIAQIYAMRMEASPTLELMEQNRELALKTAREVLARRYPQKWLVSESAAQLIRSLNDETHLREVRGWVEKRQNDPAFLSKLRLAQMQSAHLDRTPNLGGSQQNRLSPSQYSPAVPRGTAIVTYSRAQLTGDRAEAPLGKQEANQVARPKTILRGPIVIDGSRVHALTKSVSPSTVSPYAPGAEPRISASTGDTLAEPATR
jgi:hypothetical protein